MANTNDATILELQKLIKLKKENLGKSERFTPVTNCSIDFEGNRRNINAMRKDELIEMIVKLNSQLLSAKDLGLEDTYLIGGYKLEDWIKDLQSKLAILSRKDEERELQLAEAQLTKLLSNEKQVELEIDNIAKMLKLK